MNKRRSWIIVLLLLLTMPFIQFFLPDQYRLQIPHAKAAGVFFYDGFEGADETWTIWSSPDLNNTDWAYAGSESCKIDAIEGAYNDTGGTYDPIFVQARVRFSALPSSGQYIDIVGTGASIGWDSPVMIQVWHNGTDPVWRIKSYLTGFTGENGSVVLVDITYLLELEYVKAGQIKLYIDEVQESNLSSSGYNMQFLLVGYSTTGGSVYIDEFRASTTYMGPPPPVPPEYSNIGTNTTSANTTCQFHSSWIVQNSDLDWAGITHNISGSWCNNITIFNNQGSSGPAWANYSTQLNETVSQVVGYRFYGNNTDGNMTDSGIYTITLTYPSISIVTAYPGWGMYNATNIPVEISVLTPGSATEVIWYNLKNETTWVYGENQIYTTPTTMTGISEGYRYTFYAWGNNSYGTIDEETVAFDNDLGAFVAPNGTWSGILEAVTAAEAAGSGNVTIPSGVWNYTDSIVDWHQITITKPVNLYGYPNMRDSDGMVVEPYRTELNLSVEFPSTWGDGKRFFHFDGNETWSARFSDIQITGIREFNHTSENFYYTVFMDEIYNFRIDHCKFLSLGLGITVQSYNDYAICNGLIDHCNFTNTYGTAPPIYTDGTLGYAVEIGRMGQNVTWADWPDNVLGQYLNISVYIEDSYFSRFRHCISSIDGVHYVFRYNTIYHDSGFGTLDAHGTYSEFGTRAIEIYENSILDSVNATIYNSSNLVPGTGVFWRGGDGVIFNNTVRNYSTFIYQVDEGSVNKCYPNYAWIWDNNLVSTSASHSISGGQIEGQDYWYYEKPGYIPYKYPHPLQEEVPDFPPIWNISGGMSEAEPHHGDSYDLTIIKGHSSTVAEGESTLSVKWYDAEGLENGKIEHNATGALQNISRAFTGNPTQAWFNETITLPEEGKVVMWRAHAQGSPWASTSWQFIAVTEDGPSGWTFKIMGVTDHDKILGIEVANISKVNDVS